MKNGWAVVLSVFFLNGCFDGNQLTLNNQEEPEICFAEPEYDCPECDKDQAQNHFERGEDEEQNTSEVMVYTNFEEGTPVSIGDVEFIVVSILDSTCPEDVYCVWAGSITILLRSASGVSIELDSSNVAAKEIDIKGRKFRLDASLNDMKILEVRVVESH